MNALGQAIGELCKAILPIPDERFLGNSSSSIAVCTLSSIDLLKKFQNSDILNQICIAGRLLSENKGIDSIIDYTFKNKNVRTIIVCGKEVWGHKAGHSLFELYKNGIDSDCRIINSHSPDPFVTCSENKIKYFQENIHLENMINETDFTTIKDKIKSLQ